MPVNPADGPVPAGVLRRRGMKRLSAVTAGVGVAGVLATGAIAVALPGSTHNVTSASSTGGSTTSATSTTPHATSGSSSAVASSTSSSSGAKSPVPTRVSGSSDRTDATSGGS